MLLPLLALCRRSSVTVVLVVVVVGVVVLVIVVVVVFVVILVFVFVVDALVRSAYPREKGLAPAPAVLAIGAFCVTRERDAPLTTPGRAKKQIARTAIF